MGKIETKLKKMGLEIPPTHPYPSPNRTSAVQAGNLLFLSGHGTGRSAMPLNIRQYGKVDESHQTRARAVAVALVAGVAWSALAQPYPAKPIRMIVAVPPGGRADTLARLVAPKLSTALGQTVVVDNRPGANGNIAYETAARAAADGYTLVLAAAGVAINPSLYREVRFDPVKDFAAITHGISVPNILPVHPSVPAASMKELIALGKSKPVNFASAGNGSSGHLAVEQFKIVSGMQLTHIPYKGGGPALAELIGGQVQAMFSLALAATPQIKAGKVRALAITSAQRSRVAPDLPTVAELGFPGFTVIGWFGWLAPARTPHEIVTRLNGDIVKVLRGTETQERLIALGCEPVGNSSREFAAFVSAERDKWAKVIRQAGVTLD